MAATTVIHWDGKTVPTELRLLPPGRYVVSPANEDVLSPEEDAGVREGLDDLKARRVVSFERIRGEMESPSRRG